MNALDLVKESLDELNDEATSAFKSQVKAKIRQIVDVQAVIKTETAKLAKLQEELKAMSLVTIDKAALNF